MWNKLLYDTIQTKAVKQYFQVVVFVFFYIWLALLVVAHNIDSFANFFTGCFHVPRCLHMCIKMLKELLEEKTLTNGLPNGNCVQ